MGGIRFLVLVWSCVAWLGVPAAEQLQVAQPSTTRAAEQREPERARWAWNRTYASITDSGDLEWSPEPYRYAPGSSVRYIDYENGSDANDGRTEATPWKHHPWDAQAGGEAAAASGIDTYVFKRGVIYRGTLVIGESGSADAPIRLCSDPEWGSGEAMLVGSERVRGFTRGADHAKIPDAASVWWVDLDFLPRRVWAVDDDGFTRIHLARMPNWTVSDTEDVLSEWWQWQQPQWWTNKWVVKTGKGDRHLGIDAENLTGPADMYEGALIRTEYGICMGTPYPVRVESFDAERKGLVFQGLWFGASARIIDGNRYYLEDKPHFLDHPGEFWFEQRGDGGRLYLRMPDGGDPNRHGVEVGKRYHVIVDRAAAAAPARMDLHPPAQRAKLPTTGAAHLEISGLGFRFTNTWWDLELPDWMHKNVDNAAIRLRGALDSVRITNNRFVDVNKAVFVQPLTNAASVEGLLIADNEIRSTDHGAITINGAGLGGKAPIGRVDVLRNRLHTIGLRNFRQDHAHAIDLRWADLLTIAGNILDRCTASGIFVYGGKPSKGAGMEADARLRRILIHHNRAVDTLLAANDWGGIETWENGPFYLYGNISGNANGYWHWTAKNKKPGHARLGMAFYLDGSRKNYLFNNVAWGRSSDPSSPLCANTAFYIAGPQYEDWYFNNTVYRFYQGSEWSPRNGRNLYLGNLFLDISGHAFKHGKVKEDKGKVAKEYPNHTIALGANGFHQVGKHGGIGVFEKAGVSYADVDAMAAALQRYQPLRGDVGIELEQSPVRDAEAHDFRPKADSPIVDAGVTVFTPWALAATVGEWHFRPDPSDPNHIMDVGWYPKRYNTMRKRDEYPMTGENLTMDAFVDAPDEDWIASALRFDGGERIARISHEDLMAPFTYHKAVGRKTEQREIGGHDKQSPAIGTSNVLVEVLLRTDPGHTGSVVLGKMDEDAGYRLAVNGAGTLTFGLRSAGEDHELPSQSIINDGGWHHVIAELDRAAGTATIYVDGRECVRGPVALGSASLANGADFLLGAGPDGHGFVGAVAYLRICQATLAEARTSIEELYDWQFDGPARRDFMGNDITGQRRDIGAFEAQ